MGLDGLFALVVSLLVMLVCFVFVFLSGGAS
jgi:hypothetical protein